MTSIKVTYQSTIRRFTVPNTTTWSDLESRLRLIFSLPPTFEFALSYKDEDGDTIILSTDLELQEFLSSQPSQSTLRFHLVPEKRQPDTTVSENDFVSVERERFVPDDVSGSDNHVTVADDDDESRATEADDVDEFRATVPDYDETSFETTDSKGKQRAAPAASATDDQQHEEHQSPPVDDNEQRAPFLDVAEQFQQLIDQFQDVISQNPQLVEQVNTVMNHILRNIPVDVDQLALWLNSFRPEGNLGGETDNPRGEQQQRQQQRQSNDFGPFGNFIPPHVLTNSWVQRIFPDYYSGNFSETDCDYQQRREQQQPYQEEELSPETIKENLALRKKLDLLHKMGFWGDDIETVELLKRHNGNIERVVEILIEQKQGPQV